MKKIKLLLGTIAVIGGLFLFSGQTTYASTTHWDRAPKALKGEWQTATHKTPKKYSNLENRYYWKNLEVTNKIFQLNTFMLNKHKVHDYESGPHGAYSHVYSLAFEKVSSRRYYVWGSMLNYGSSKAQAGFGIVLSHSHKHLKLYSFKAKMKHGYVDFTNRHYEGYYRRGMSH